MKDGKSSSATGASGAALVAHVQQRREAERTALSRMLHHDVAGMLAAARMDLSRLLGRVADDESQDQVRRIDQLLDQVIRDARREMQRLHPALIDHFGLPLAVRHLVEERSNAAGLRYNMSLDEVMEGVDSQVLIAAFRVVETVLADGRDYAEFNARIAPRRDGYVLEVTATRAPGTASSPDVTRAADLDALRTWLRTLGAGWQQSISEARVTYELRLPRASAPVPVVASDVIKDEAPGG